MKCYLSKVFVSRKHNSFQYGREESMVEVVFRDVPITQDVNRLLRWFDTAFDAVS